MELGLGIYEKATELPEELLSDIEKAAKTADESQETFDRTHGIVSGIRDNIKVFEGGDDLEFKDYYGAVMFDV